MQKFIIIIFIINSIVGLSQHTTVECMEDIALSLQGSKYVANTLNTSQTEKLTYHSDRFDCVTFVEYVIAQAMYHTSNVSFEKVLTNLRYRNGKIEGYGSRIHYFSEWLVQAEKSGLITIIKMPHSLAFTKKIDFMSTHRQLYKKAKHADWPIIEKSEQYVSNLNLSYVPKDKVKNIYGELKEMDIIAITTSISGLDISHTGFIHFKNGLPHLIHASESGKLVLISNKPLADYLLSNKKQSGIIVARTQ